MAKPPAPRLLHLHAQQHQHDEAYIVGNRTGLQALRDALNVVLNAPVEGIEAWAVEAMAGDGEAFDLVIVLDDSTWTSPTWRKAALPYAGSDAREGRAEVLWPEAVAGEPVRLLAAGVATG